MKPGLRSAAMALIAALLVGLLAADALCQVCPPPVAPCRLERAVIVAPARLPQMPLAPARVCAGVVAPTRICQLPVAPQRICAMPVAPKRVCQMPVPSARICAMPVAPQRVCALPISPARACTVYVAAQPCRPIKKCP